MRTITTILTYLVLTAVVLALMAIPLYYLWNLVIPYLFGLPTLHPMDAFLLLSVGWIFMTAMKLTTVDITTKVSPTPQPMRMEFTEEELERLEDMYEIFIDTPKTKEEEEK